jgi:hypothetical protein
VGHFLAPLSLLLTVQLCAFIMVPLIRVLICQRVAVPVIILVVKVQVYFLVSLAVYIRVGRRRSLWVQAGLALLPCRLTVTFISQRAIRALLASAVSSRSQMGLLEPIT